MKSNWDYEEEYIFYLNDAAVKYRRDSRLITMKRSEFVDYKSTNKMVLRLQAKAVSDFFCPVYFRYHYLWDHYRDIMPFVNWYISENKKYGSILDSVQYNKTAIGLYSMGFLFVSYLLFYSMSPGLYPFKPDNLFFINTTFFFFYFGMIYDFFAVTVSYLDEKCTFLYYEVNKRELDTLSYVLNGFPVNQLLFLYGIGLFVSKGHSQIRKIVGSSKMLDITTMESGSGGFVWTQICSCPLVIFSLAGCLYYHNEMKKGTFKSKDLILTEIFLSLLLCLSILLFGLYLDTKIVLARRLAICIFLPYYVLFVLRVIDFFLVHANDQLIRQRRSSGFVFENIFKPAQRNFWLFLAAIGLQVYAFITYMRSG